MQEACWWTGPPDTGFVVCTWLAPAVMLSAMLAMPEKLCTRLSSGVESDSCRRAWAPIFTTCSMQRGLMKHCKALDARLASLLCSGWCSKRHRLPAMQCRDSEAIRLQAC